MRRITRRTFLKTVGAGLVGVALLAPGGLARGQEAPGYASDDEDLPIVFESNLSDLDRVGRLSTAAVDIGAINNCVVRVNLALSATSGTLDHSSARVTADGTFDLINLAASGGHIASGASAGTSFTITVTEGGWLRVERDSDGWVAGDFTGPIRLLPRDNQRLVQVLSITRDPYGNPRYRGYLEITRDGAAAGKLRVQNVLDPGWVANPLETYLYGVVPGEMPVSYHIEALKAQAVAARTYAAARYSGGQIVICDSTYCQVYYGVNAEREASTRAVDETRGVIATYGGNVISAQYSSTCGGHTEHVENVYTSYVPYLRGVRCYHDGSVADISSEDAARRFWASATVGQPTPSSYCSSSSRYRWSPVERTREQLQQSINAYLGTNIGELRRLEVEQRGVSGKISVLRVRNARGQTWKITGDYGVRQAIGGSTLFDSSNLVFDHVPDSGTLSKVIINGGGYGHGVGLCQVGAHGMALAAKSYADILRHYYTGIVLKGGNVPPPVPTPTSHPLVLVNSPVTVAWTGAASKYYAEFRRAGDPRSISSGWSSSTSWSLGVLGLGTYEWRVKGRTSAGESSFCPWQRLLVVEKIYSSRLPLVYK